MGWYRTGTVQVTNGSPNVVGTGTSWVDNIRQSWAIVGPDGKVYEVLSVSDDTHLTLATNYTGTSLSGQPYQAYPTQGELRDLAAGVAALIASVAGMVSGAGAGRFADGSAAAPGMSFASDIDSGFYRVGTNSFGVSTGGAPRMLWDAAGNVAIGNGTASRKLDVYGDSGIGVHPTTDNGVMTFSISSTTGQSIIDCYSGPYTSSLLVRANSTPGGATGTIAQFAAAGSGIGGLGIDGQGLTVYNAALMTGGAATTSTSPALSGLRAGFLSGSNEAFLEAVNASDASLSIRTKVTGAAPAVVARFNALGGMTLFNVVGVPGNGSVYMEGGALKFKGGSGTVTTLANP